MHENSRLLFRKHALGYLAAGQRVLEIGPDRFPSTYFAESGLAQPWDTLDIYEDARLNFRATDEYTFPVPADQYDVVLSGQVIEHVRKPWIWLREVARVCKPGGHVITINPVSWPYHEHPIDGWRMYPEAMRALYDDAGLEVLFSECTSLEQPGYRNYAPGRSKDYQPDSWKWRLFRRIAPTLGYPVERAYDTITIGRKPINGA